MKLSAAQKRGVLQGIFGGSNMGLEMNVRQIDVDYIVAKVTKGDLDKFSRAELSKWVGDRLYGWIFESDEQYEGFLAETKFVRRITEGPFDDIVRVHKLAERPFAPIIKAMGLIP